MSRVRSSRVVESRPDPALCFCLSIQLVYVGQRLNFQSDLTAQNISSHQIDCMRRILLYPKMDFDRVNAKFSDEDQ